MAIISVLPSRAHAQHQGGYGPPGYGPPPAQPAAAGPPLVVEGWDPDAPVPDGYALRTKPNTKLIGYGTGMFSMGWVTSAFVALIATQQDDTEDPADWYPLYLPIVGPAVAIGTLDTSGAATGVLLADTIVQAAGILAIVIGAVDTQNRIIRTQLGDRGPSLHITPMVGRQTGLSAGITY